jgi:hypothetical protein
MLVLVQHAAEAVTSVDGQVGEPVRVGDRPRRSRPTLPTLRTKEQLMRTRQRPSALAPAVAAIIALALIAFVYNGTGACSSWLSPAHWSPATLHAAT